MCNETTYLISDSPIVNLKFGTSLDPSNIAEGNDVYFECEIDANPDVYKIVWLHNVSCKKFEFHMSTMSSYYFYFPWFFILNPIFLKGCHGRSR